MYVSIKNDERENLFRVIVEAIRSTLNIDVVKKAIVDVIGKTINADRCFIMEYDKIKDEFLTVNYEYLSSKNVLPYKGVNINENIPNAISEFKKGKILILTKKKFN